MTKIYNRHEHKIRTSDGIVIYPHSTVTVDNGIVVPDCEADLAELQRKSQLLEACSSLAKPSDIGTSDLVKASAYKGWTNWTDMAPSIRYDEHRSNWKGWYYGAGDGSASSDYNWAIYNMLDSEYARFRHNDILKKVQMWFNLELYGQFKGIYQMPLFSASVPFNYIKNNIYFALPFSNSARTVNVNPIVDLESPYPMKYTNSFNKLNTNGYYQYPWLCIDKYGQVSLWMNPDKLANVNHYNAGTTIIAKPTSVVITL